jgi:hypothetical protein
MDVLEGWHPYLMSEYIVGTAERHIREYTVHEVELLLKSGGFEMIALDTRNVWDGSYPEMRSLLASLGKPTHLRGDNTFALARKKTGVLERYPEKIYMR